jgi:nitroreductase
MELAQVIGDRRSTRWYQPWRPVEREKIQTILHAAHLASRAVNAGWAKAIVVNRDDLSEEDREGLKTATTTAQLDLAPTYIFWFLDTEAWNEGHETLQMIVGAHALTPAFGWSPAYVEDVVYPQVLHPWSQSTEGLYGLGGCEAGVAIAQSLLVAVDLGLGTQLTAFQGAKAQEVLGFPDHYFPLWIQLVGYSAENAVADGQRPRPPLTDQFFEGRYGTPFEPDQGVIETLREAGMIQDVSPAPWRESETRGLARMFGLPE